MSGNRGKGRPKGSVNKSTASVKAAMEAAFECLGAQDAFNAWAQDNKDIFYGQLLPKLLPIQLNHADHEGGKLVITWQGE